MAYEFFVVMQKRVDGKVYADLHKTDERMYLIESEADDALARMSESLRGHFHKVRIVGVAAMGWPALFLDIERRQKMTILNLTQHKATPDQIAAGVVDLPDAEREKLSRLLTFETLPTLGEIIARANELASLAALNAPGEERDDEGWLARAAMIGGAPWLMASLEMELLANGIRPVYAFSVRETEEVAQPDGSVRKVTVFRHVGFVEVS